MRVSFARELPQPPPTALPLTLAPLTHPAELRECSDALLPNFQAACKLTGFPCSAALLHALEFPIPESTPDAPKDITTVRAAGRADGPNVRALCAAVLARGTGLKAVPYRPLKHIVLHEAECGDSGAAAVAEVLRNGCLVEVAVEGVTLLRCSVGVEGARALGGSLVLGACASLQYLSLDLNPALGDAGVHWLCRGLNSNNTLKRLSLSGCGMGPDGAEDVAAVVNAQTCVLESIDLSGNDIGLAGLRSLAVAASYSKTLQELLLCNCALSSRCQEDAAALALIRGVKESGGGRAGVANGGGSGGVVGAAAAAAAPAGGSGGGGGGALPAAEDGAGSAAAAIAQKLGTEAFSALGAALASTDCALGRVDLEGNPMSAEDAEALLPHLAANPAKVTMLKVPVTLSKAHFTALFRNVVAKGKKKK